MGKIIGGYYPYNYEVDAIKILEDLEKKDFSISLPKIKKNLDDRESKIKEDLDEAKDKDEDTMDEAKDKDLDEAKDDEKEMEEAVGYPNYRADQITKVKADATDVNQGLNESIDTAARWKKLANIK